MDREKDNSHSNPATAGLRAHYKRRCVLPVVVSLALTFLLSGYTYGESDKEFFSAAYKKGNMEKNAQEALTLYRKILTEYPTSDLCDDAQWGIVNLHPRLIPDYKQGIEEAQKLLEQFPDSKWADHALRKIIGLTYHYEKNLDKTIELIKIFLDKYPKSQFFEEEIYLMAKIYREKGNYAEAIKIGENLLLNHPDFRDIPGVLMFIGTTYRFDLNDPERSLGYFKKVLSGHPLSIESYQALCYQAGYYIEKGDKDKALQIYRSFLTKYPNHRRADKVRRIIEKLKEK